MDGKSSFTLNQQKAKLQTGFGCFFSLIMMGVLFMFIPIWLFLTYGDETELKVSYSPNHINKIEIVQKDDFPDPTLRIKFDNKDIMKTKLPDDISVQWINDFEAEVILTRRGKEQDTVRIEFK